MNKKTIISVGLLLLLLVVFAITYKYSNFFTKNPTNTQPSHKSALEISGLITDLKANSITVQGKVKSQDGIGAEINKTIDFQITSETKLRRRRIIITAETINNKRTLNRQLTDEIGNVSDLKKNTQIISATSNQDLSSNSKAIAKDIFYIYNDPKSL